MGTSFGIQGAGHDPWSCHQTCLLEEIAGRHWWPESKRVYQVGESLSREDRFLADEDIGKVGGQFLAYPLVTVASDSWCAVFTAIWAGEGSGWGWLEASCSFGLLRLSSAAPNLYVSCLRLTFLTDKRQLSWSGASCCLHWWLIPACASCLFRWSLKRQHA